MVNSIKNVRKYESTVMMNYPSCPIENNPNPNWWIYRTMAFAGHTVPRSKEIGEFYAMISNSLTYNDVCGQYKNLIKKKDGSFLQYYIPFKTENELKNFWNYIHTNFNRICLWFIKTTLSIQNGELKYIPWFDFSDSIFNNSPEEIDKALFKKYGIKQEIIDHILDILPNYYNLDLTKYKVEN